jgi:hypothetical protein
MPAFGGGETPVDGDHSTIIAVYTEKVGLILGLILTGLGSRDKFPTGTLQIDSQHVDVLLPWDGTPQAVLADPVA